MDNIKNIIKMAILQKLLKSEDLSQIDTDEVRKLSEEAGMESGLQKSDDEDVELEHWSKNPLLSELDPQKHGHGLKGAESKRKEAFPESFIPRTYHYSKGTKPESGLGKFKYNVKIPKKDIYDLSTDPDQLFDQTPKTEPYFRRLNLTEQKVKEKGYRGAYIGKLANAGDSENIGMVYITFGPEHLGIKEEEVKKSEEVQKAIKRFSNELLSGLHGSFSILTAENPKGRSLSPDDNKIRNTQLEEDMKSHGLKYIKTQGKYGNKENSFIVVNAHNPEVVNSLAEKYEQESVIHSVKGENSLLYVTGKNKGLRLTGTGHSILDPKEDKDLYTKQRRTKFSLNIDFNKPLQKSEQQEEMPIIELDILEDDLEALLTESNNEEIDTIYVNRVAHIKDMLKDIESNKFLASEFLSPEQFSKVAQILDVLENNSEDSISDDMLYYFENMAIILSNKIKRGAPQ